MQGVGLTAGELFGGTGLVVDKIIFEIAVDDGNPCMLCFDHGHQQHIAALYLREAPRRCPHRTHCSCQDGWIAPINTQSGRTSSMHLERCTSVRLKQRAYGDFRSEVGQRTEQLKGVDKCMHITGHERRIVCGHHVVGFGVLDSSVEQHGTGRHCNTTPCCQIEEHSFGTHAVFL